MAELKNAIKTMSDSALTVESSTATKVIGVNDSSEAVKIDLNDKASVNVYLPASVPLSITAGTPKSPTSYLINAGVPANKFSYTGGSLVYTGLEKIEADVIGTHSISTTTFNFTAFFYFGKNGVLDITTKQQRSLGSASDVGSVTISGKLILETNDTIDFFVDIDSGTENVTINTSNVSVNEFRKIV